MAVALLVGLTIPGRSSAAEPPQAKADQTPKGDVALGEIVTFDARDSKNAIEHIWDFGDGYQATGEVVTHRFTTAGAYVVSLMVRNEVGQWNQQLQEVRVTPYIEKKIVEPVEIQSQGITLRGTVTRPDSGGTFPSILEYGPYGAGSVGDGNWNRSLIRSGYAYVKVSMPARDRSGGRFDMFGRATALGGYDSVEWIAEQPWSDGKVGLAGFSGPAVAALATTTTRPPHLVTVAVKGSFSDFYRDIVHVGGTYNSNTFVNAWNALFFAEAATTQADTPVADLPMHQADVLTAAADMNGRVLYDDYWAERNFTARPAPVPILYHGTHRDIWPRAAPELFRWIAPAGGRVTLMYGGHGSIDPTGYNPSMQIAQEGGYGEVALGETRAWFDHFLKGVDNGVEARAPLSVLVPRGADWNAAFGSDWLGLQDWPDPSTGWRTLHLDAGGVLGEGVAGDFTPDTALGGAGWGLTGNADIDSAQQVAYATGPLDRDLTVVGPVTLILHASIASPDAAWNVQLQEMLADGSVRQVQDGQLQASHRALDEATRSAVGEIIQPVHPHDAMDPVEPGRSYEYAIEIPTVFDTFMEGSRIRLVIAANDARPALDGHATAPTAVTFSVFHDALRDSRLTLPVVDRARLSLPLPYTGGAG